jgi:hypothetical protein
MSSTRRLVSVSALAALLLLTATMASNAAGPWPSAVGAGSTGDGTKFSFSALEGPSSTRGDYGSFGHARIDLGNGARIQGPVQCVTVDTVLFQAWFVFQYTDAGGNVQQARIYVKDGGDNAAQGGDFFGWDTNNACVTSPVDGTRHPADVITLPTNNQPAVKGNILVSTD